VEKVEQLLASVQKNCRARCLEYGDILFEIEYMTERLYEMGLCNSNLSGATFHFKNGHTVAGSYNGIPESTQFKLFKGATGWFITQLSREPCNYKATMKFTNESKYQQFYKF